MEKQEYILINVKGSKNFKGKLRWNLKLPNNIAAPLFTFLAALQTEARNYKKKFSSPKSK